MLKKKFNSLYYSPSLNLNRNFPSICSNSNLENISFKDYINSEKDSGRNIKKIENPSSSKNILKKTPASNYYNERSTFYKGSHTSIHKNKHLLQRTNNFTDALSANNTMEMLNSLREKINHYVRIIRINWNKLIQILFHN